MSWRMPGSENETYCAIAENVVITIHQFDRVLA
jgi:hypothetical protein